MLLEVLWSVYQTLFSVFFIVSNLALALLVLYKILDYLLARELDVCGSYALITGCDSGFGLSAAYKLNERNVHVLAACLTQDAVQRFTEDENFRGTAFRLNITQKEEVENTKKVIEDVVKEEGLRFLFNNAGIIERGPIEWHSVADMKRVLEVNLWGHVNVTKAMLPLLKRARGRIINTTSIAGRISAGGLSAYSMSKYAFEAFSDALRLEMKPWGVSVHIIEPGFMRTNLYRNVDQLKQLWDKQPTDIKEAYGEEYYENWLKVNDPSAVDKLADDPSCVVNAYLHAALSSRPKLRYLVGIPAYFLAFTVGLLPTCVGDFVFELLKRAHPVKLKPAKADACKSCILG